MTASQRSEQLVTYALWVQGLSWLPLKMRATRVRSNGHHVDEDFSVCTMRRMRQKLRLSSQWLWRGIWPGRDRASP